MVSSLIQQAREAARKQLERLYEGVCTIYRYENIYDSTAHCTRANKSVLYENQPCRISYNRTDSAEQTDTVARVSQEITLFISSDINIPAGSIISATQEDSIVEYETSGQMVKYPTHQEIGLILANKEA